jgi:hypothetical protein
MRVILARSESNGKILLALVGQGRPLSEQVVYGGRDEDNLAGRDVRVEGTALVFR